MKSVLALLAIAGCNYDLSLDRNGIGADGGPHDSGADAGPVIGPLPEGVSYLRHGAWRILVDGADLIVAGAPQVWRLHPDGTADVLMTVDHGWVDVHAQDAERIYLVHTYENGTRYGILAFDKATGAVTTLTNDWGQILSVTNDASMVYFATSVRVAGEARGELVRIDKRTGGTRILYIGLEEPLGLAVDEYFVYVADDANHRVLAVSTSGGRSFDLAPNVNRPSSVLPHGDQLYFTERGNTYTDGKISRVPRPSATSNQPGIVETIAGGLAHPTELVIDADQIFATSYFRGLYQVGMNPGSAATLVVDTIAQGNGPIAGADHRIYFSARYPDNSGSLIYVVESSRLQ